MRPPARRPWILPPFLVALWAAPGCREATLPAGPGDRAQPDPTLAAPTRTEVLRGRVVDAYGAPLGPGLRVTAIPRTGEGAGIWPGTETDAEGRFDLGGRALPLPLDLHAASGARYGILPVFEAPDGDELRVVALPLFGRRVLLRDADGEAVRWPVQAAVPSSLSADPRLEHLGPEGRRLLGFDAPPRAGGATHTLLATLRGEPGEGPGPLEWRLEVPGYEFARLTLELLPLSEAGAPAEVEFTLQRSAPGFGDLEVLLPAGLSAPAGEPSLGGLSLVLEAGARAGALSYELLPDADGRAHLVDLPAGSYRARLSVRGRYLLPPRSEAGSPLELSPGSRARLDLSGPAWAGLEAEVVLPGGELHGGTAHFELRPGWGHQPRTGGALEGELRSYPGPPYRFDPLPPGRYTLLLRRLPGLVDPEPIANPFEDRSESELPRLELELAPGERKRVRLAPPG